MRTHTALFLAMSVMMVGCDEPESSSTGGGSEVESQASADEDSLASASSKSVATAEATELVADDIGNSLVDTYEIEESSSDLPACMSWESNDAVWLDGDQITGWGFHLMLEDCTEYGYNAVSGDVYITFDNLSQLPQTATQLEVYDAAYSDLVQWSKGNLDLYMETGLVSAYDGEIAAYGFVGYDESARTVLFSEFDATVVSSYGDELTLQWSSSTVVSGDVVYRDSTGSVVLDVVGLPELSRGLDVARTERRVSDELPYAGTITLTADRLLTDRQTTVSFSEDSPTTGDVEVTLDNGDSYTLTIPVS